ncbi:MAG: TonB-dependent receptor [Bacteroidota bacterium]
MTSALFKLCPEKGQSAAQHYCCRWRRAILPILLLLCCPAWILAQSVSGTVIDEGGEPLIGVNILIQGSSRGTVTDIDGTYSLNAAAADVLVFSYTGFSSQEVTVGTQTTIDITLSEDAEVLEEVVVIGYGVIRKSDLTGSVARIDGEEITGVVAGNPTSALQGKLSGVQVENNGGEPGGAANVFVRGVGSFTNSFPLYVIDGTFADNMNFLNAKDIQSIEVLKDASAAAIYGSRAANGVVLITTKRGSSDGRPVVSLDLRSGIDAPARQLDFLNGQQFEQYRNQLEQNDGTGFVFSSNGVSTDWQDLSLNSGAVLDYGLSISGGSDKSNYFISGNFFDQDGILVGSDFNRINLRANSDFTLGRLTISESISIAQTETQFNNWFGFDGATAPNLRLSVPENEGGFEAPNFDDHNFGGYNDYGRAVLEDNQTTNRNLLGNFNIGYELAEGLVAKVNLGVDYLNTHQYTFTPTFFMSPSDAQFNLNDQNDLIDTRSELLRTLIEPTLSYSGTLGLNSRINAVIGATSQNTNFRSIGISGQNTPSNNIRVASGLPTASILQLFGIEQETRLRSVFGRVNLSLSNRYLFTATIRRDESSRFDEEFRAGYFPSASFGWRVSNEDFWPTTSVVNNLKLRVGYGELGSQNIANPYPTQPVVDLTSPTSIGGAIVPGFALTTFANRGLQWETAKTFNVGFDLGLWDDRLTLSAEYYNKDIENVLVAINIPSSNGTINPVPQNVGEINNSGLEFDGIFRAINNGNFKLDFGFNFSTFNSEVTTLPNPILGPSTTEDATRVNRFIEGAAPGVYFGFVVDGVYADEAAIASDPNIANDESRRSLVQPGDFIRRDLNGDGMITVADQTILGDPTPDFIYGFNFTGSLGNLDFGLFFQGSQGNEIYNVNKFYNLFWADDNKLTDVLRGWTPTNTNTDIPRATTLDPAENRAASSFFVEDGSYLRLRTMELGYTLNVSDVVWLQNLRLFVSGQNLVTLTGYSGYNPDISSATGGRVGQTNPLLARGLDVRAYPLARTFLFGVQATF